MKKGLVILMAAAMVFAFTGAAFALQDPPTGNPALGGKGNIVPNQQTPVGHDGATKDYGYFEQGVESETVQYNPGLANTSTHVYGTWNSPYTAGIDGYNYNDAQDYVMTGEQTTTPQGKLIFQSGPHGGYLTTTHRCRECHAVHRAAGKFKLLRSDTRFEACDWCHGVGAGSGFNIQMDNDSGYTEEYNVGHTMGFGISSNKWKAPDDTFPAFTPNYYMGGFSCFDCHSPHANPARIMGFDGGGNAYGLPDGSGKIYGIANPGHDVLADDTTHIDTRPIYLSGSWLLIKNPDREIAVTSETGASIWIVGTGGSVGSPDTTDIVAGQEISDLISSKTDSTGQIVQYGALRQFTGSADATFPVNKIPIDWDNPIGTAGKATTGDPNPGFSSAGTTDVWSVSEFCTDCHDGNAGQHTVAAPLFSEDRALRGTVPATTTLEPSAEFRGSYDLAYGHDAQPRHACERQMKFDPEDGQDFGPSCRNCHKGSSACNTCHAQGQAAWPVSSVDAALDDSETTAYDVARTTTGEINPIGASADAFYKKSQTVTYAVTDGSTSWRDSASVVGAGITMTCADDGFSWPHRTLGWKMLKDDLFGLDFIGPEGIDNAGQGGDSDGYAEYGESRSDGANAHPVHDLDSICLDCHNPTVWNATAATDHIDDPADDANAANDNMDDDLLLRGLP